MLILKKNVFSRLVRKMDEVDIEYDEGHFDDRIFPHCLFWTQKCWLVGWGIDMLYLFWLKIFCFGCVQKMYFEWKCVIFPFDQNVTCLFVVENNCCYERIVSWVNSVHWMCVWPVYWAKIVILLFWVQIDIQGTLMM